MASNPYIARSGDNTDITPGELKAIEKAMENKEFRDLLVEYVNEISDPKHKEEYEQYLRQLEGNKELPKDMKLIQPTAGFCIKTTVKNKNRPNFSQKLFVNVCSAKEIQKPSSTESTDKAKGRGQHWQIPYSVGGIKPDQDSKKNVCNTVDVVFHPFALEMCSKSEQFTKLICDTAIDGATKQLTDQNDKVSRDYKILKRVKCKGEKPSLLPMRTSKIAGEKEEKAQPNENLPKEKNERQEDQVPKLFQQFQQQQKAYLENKKEEAENEKKRRVAATSRIQELASYDFDEVEEEKGKKKEEKPNGVGKIAAPKYSLVYSYDVELGEFMNGREKKQQRPKILNLQVELPGVDKITELELDINDREFILKAKDKYYLDLKLPYKVLKDEGKAKFESKQKILKVSLPIDKASLPPEQELVSQDLEKVTNGEATEEKPEGNEALPQKDSEPRDGVDQNAVANAQIINEKAEYDVSDSYLEFKSEASGLKFVDHEQIERQKEEELKRLEKGLLDEEGKSKVLVQEVERPETQKASADGIATNTNGQAEKQISPVLPKKAEFKTQDIVSNYFFIFHLPKYEKSQISFAFFEDQVLMKYVSATEIPVFWAKLNKKINTKESQCNFVTDYVVLNLKKAEEGFWEQSDWTENGTDGFLLAIEYNNEFEKLLSEYHLSQSPMMTEKKIPDNQSATTAETSVQGNNNPEESSHQEEAAESKQEDKPERIQVQLLQFDKSFFAYELD